MALVSVLLLSVVLGSSSFLFGLLPLTISFSRTRVARLSILGTGLLLGAAIGVIIPEGIETIYDYTTKENASLGSGRHHVEPPTFTIAMSLLFGFTFMLLAEQVSSRMSPSLSEASTSSPPHRSPPRSYPIDTLRASSSGYLSPSRPLSPTTATSITEGDLDLDLDVELNNFGNFNDRDAGWQHAKGRDLERRRDPRVLTFGLVVHSLADGLALGASLVTNLETQSTTEGTFGSSSLDFSSLPLVIFFALALHKAPASLALTSSLMTQLPSRVVRIHLLIFSLAAPTSAVVTYSMISWFDGMFEAHGAWTGKALLFSGGTFLYVATQLSPISAHVHSGETDTAAMDAKLSPWARLAIITGGMMAPALMANLVGHGH